ncbi:ABC transporter permease [Chloroflexota bacterium]
MNQRSASGRGRITLLLWLIPLAFLGVFYFYPLARILGVSFARAQGGYVDLFRESITSPTVKRAFSFTLWQALLSTILTLLVGLPGAYLFGRYQFRAKTFLRAITGIPFVLPTLVVAAAFNALLGPRGWVNLAVMNFLNLETPPIQFINTFGAILVAHVFYNTTIVLRLVGDFWSHLDPRLEQAAQVLGANRRKAFRHVTLPLLAPAILAAALLVFIFDFTSFGVILVLGGPRFATLEVEIYYQTISLFNLPLAAVLSILQLGCTLGLTIAYAFLSARLSRPLSLQPQKSTQKRLSTWRSRLLAITLLILLFTLLSAPLLALAARSFVLVNAPRGGPPESVRLTLDFYRELAINRRDSLFFVPPTTAILVSLAYAGATVLLALTLGLPAAWALSRDHDSRLGRVLDSILMLPLGTSAVTLGLGFIIAMNRPPLNLLESPVLIAFAHTLVAFPFVVRSLTPALRSISPRLRQAASVMGASPQQVFRYIDIPLVGRALFVSAIFAFSISLGEFGATALVTRPEYPTIPVMIHRFISQPGALNYGQAMALSTILMLITAAGMITIERFRIADIGEF